MLFLHYYMFTTKTLFSFADQRGQLFIYLDLTDLYDTLLFALYNVRVRSTYPIIH